MPQSILEGIACVLSEKVIPHSGVVYCQGDEVEDLFLIYKGGVKVGSLYEFRQHPWPMGYSSTFNMQSCIRDSVMAATIHLLRQGQTISCRKQAVGRRAEQAC